MLKGFNVVDLRTRQREIRSGAQVGAEGKGNKVSIDKENSKEKGEPGVRCEMQK